MTPTRDSRLLKYCATGLMAAGLCLWLYSLCGCAVVPVIPVDGPTLVWGTGVSMEPTMHGGRYYTVVPALFSELVCAPPPLGTIVKRRMNGQSTTHRCRFRRPDGTIITQGDNNRFPDPDPMTPDDLYGKVEL